MKVPSGVEWYNILILGLALIGIVVNISCLVLLVKRRKCSMFYTLIKVKLSYFFYSFLTNQIVYVTRLFVQGIIKLYCGGINLYPFLHSHECILSHSVNDGKWWPKKGSVTSWIFRLQRQGRAIHIVCFIIRRLIKSIFVILYIRGQYRKYVISFVFKVFNLNVQVLITSISSVLNPVCNNYN